MRPPKLRWLLPIGHFLIDSTVLVLWIWHGSGLWMYQEKSQIHSIVRPVLFLQEATVTFEIRDIEPDPMFLFLTSGNLPAAIASEAARPRAAIQNRKRLWDPIWFTIHEGISFALWWLIGVQVDLGRFRVKKTMIGFLATRLATIPLLYWRPIAVSAWKLEGFFWLALGVCAILWIIFRLVRIVSRFQA